MIASDEADLGSPATDVFQGSAAWNRPAVVAAPEPVDAVLEAAEDDAVAVDVDEAELAPPAPPTPVAVASPPLPVVAEVLDATDVAVLDDATVVVAPDAVPELACDAEDDDADVGGHPRFGW